MADGDSKKRWSTDGKFFRSWNERTHMLAVTYGPFPGGWPASFEPDFQRIAAAGFNAIRLFEMPDRNLLDCARQHGLRVFGGLLWGQNADFFQHPALYSMARVDLVRALKETERHPALAGVYVGNEIPADLVRWMGPVKVRQAIEDLITLGRATAPDLLFAYANYPGTEYLEPENADFSAFNVYLEDPVAFRKYLKRLHHIAGDRPLVISEFGLDSCRNGLERQAEVLDWALRISSEEETAGLTVYSWSDRWWNHGSEVTDWDFGLTDRAGNDKPALEAITKFSAQAPPSADRHPRFSVIVCTRNGRGRLGRCLNNVRSMVPSVFETIVVDDGSDDGTADYVAEHFAWVKLLRLDPCGLGAARNAGAAAASGEILAFTDDDCEPDREWLARVSRLFADGRYAAVGGPNLPPKPRTWREAVVCAAPGAPSHVMIDDEDAEHLPGCNLTVTKEAFDAIGGFDPQFHTAGDDVDFCWRLRDADYRLGFAPGAFVWHWRRPLLRAFLRQQIGYGMAERLLIAKHPEHFSKGGGAMWRGFVYGGGPVRATAGSIIYHGTMGTAGYQAVTNRMLPLRGLPAAFAHIRARLALQVAGWLVPALRGWVRSRSVRCNWWKSDNVARPAGHPHELAVSGSTRDQLLQQLQARGWRPGGPTDPWDVQQLDTKIMLATEEFEGGHKHVLLRIWGGVGWENPDFPRQVLRLDNKRVTLR